MPTLIHILTATFLISLASFVGVLTLSINKKLLQKILLSLVAFAAGTLMGGAALHLLPEAIELIDNLELVFILTLISFSAFYLLEKYLHWRHCHHTDCHVHNFAYINLVGDSIHNFIDGLIIAAAFLADPKLGIITSLAMASHEIPQEIGDFAVLIYAKFKRQKAIWLNFLVALTVVLGGIVGYLIGSGLENFTNYLLPIAAGGFIYIAASDLLPEIRKERDFKKSLASFMLFIAGLVLMYLLTYLELA